MKGIVKPSIHSAQHGIVDVWDKDACDEQGNMLCVAACIPISHAKRSWTEYVRTGAVLEF